jgi:hypothetical protein
VGANARVDRRAVLAWGAGLTLTAAGCTASPPSPVKSPQSPVGGTTAPAASPSGPAASPPATATPSGSLPRVDVALPSVRPWQPSDGDIDPQVKLRAVRVIEAVGSWPAGQEGRAAAAARVTRVGEAGGLARQAPGLLRTADRAVVEVIDAQYGGILSGSASVLVVCRQWQASGRTLLGGGTTVDVRLLRTAGQWRVTALHPADPGSPESTPSSLARQVLGNSRIALPPASVADVKSGHVHDSVLTAILKLSERYAIGVSVIRSGHPTYVFGTSRLSDHPRGRAFDTWRIDDRAVVDPATPKGLITGYMEAAAAAGSYNVGGPYLLPGTGDQFFSDATHHDHVHVGFLA